MITRVFSQGRLSKNEKKRFIPYVNQRNFMGSLLNDHNKSLRQPDLKDDMRMIENINKTTKQYLFEKKYNKMVKKWKAIEDSMEKKQADIDEQVKLCLDSLLKANLPAPQHKQKMYIEASQQMALKTKIIKNQIIAKMKQKRVNKLKNKRCKTLKLEQQFEQKEQMRNNKQSRLKTSKWAKQTQINKEIFKNISNRSEYMTNVTNQGRKYKYLLNGKKINPWKSWYKHEQIEIYPGQIVKCKKLQKSIY